MDPLARKVARRFLAKTFEGDGTITRPLEQATFANGNGGFTITLYERTPEPTGPDFKVYRSYGLLTSISHFSLSTETDIPLGNSSVTTWLQEALARIQPLVQAADTGWSDDFVGKPELSYVNGEEVEELNLNEMAGTNIEQSKG